MLAWQERVVKEHRKLDEKLSKLSDFIDTPEYDELPEKEQDLLFRQRQHMREYANVLVERIAQFGE